MDQTLHQAALEHCASRLEHFLGRDTTALIYLCERWGDFVVGNRS